MHAVRRSLVAGTVVLAALACAASADAKTKTETVIAGPPARPAANQLDFNAFFRKQVTINVGDSVKWVFHGFHTVTFRAGQRGPTLVHADPGNLVQGIND